MLTIIWSKNSDSLIIPSVKLKKFIILSQIMYEGKTNLNFLLSTFFVYFKGLTHIDDIVSRKAMP